MANITGGTFLRYDQREITGAVVSDGRDYIFVELPSYHKEWTSKDLISGVVRMVKPEPETKGYKILKGSSSIRSNGIVHTGKALQELLKPLKGS